MKDENFRVDCIRKVLPLLPPGNYAILKRLMGLLWKVSQKNAVNKMTAQNLAIVFAPTVFRHQHETLDIVIQDASVANRLIETFILKYEQLFPVIACFSH